MDLSHVRANPTKSQVFIVSTLSLCHWGEKTNFSRKYSRMVLISILDTVVLFCSVVYNYNSESSNPQVIRSSSSSFGLRLEQLCSLVLFSLLTQFVPPLCDTFVTAYHHHPSGSHQPPTKHGRIDFEARGRRRPAPVHRRHGVGRTTRLPVKPFWQPRRLRNQTD